MVLHAKLQGLKAGARENPLFCALDTADLGHATDLARILARSVGGLKIGLELFAAHGPDAVRGLAGFGLPLFLDLKLHDIPNTVGAAMRAVSGLGAAVINVHATGGAAMMRAAAEAASGSGSARPAVIAVTVLTSLDQGDLAAIGIAGSPTDLAARLALSARQAGLDGVVCSAQDIAAIRRLCGPDFLLVVPGLRPAGSAAGDQKRIMTPRAARAAGADILVVGRPITQAPDPAGAARAIVSELAAT